MGGVLDVVVVGAGPAGALTALLLARAGVRVLLLDGKRFGRDKPCGEGLMPRGVAILERAGLGAVLDGAPALCGVALRAGGRRVETSFGRLAGRGVRRQRLDARLVEAAAQAGAEARFSSPVRALQRDGQGLWQLVVGRDTPGGAWSLPPARVLVIADGGRSAIRWTTGGRGRRRETGERGPGAPYSRPHRRAGGAGRGRAQRLGVVAHLDAGAIPSLRGRAEAWLDPRTQLVLTPVEGGVVSVAALLEPGLAGVISRAGHGLGEPVGGELRDLVGGGGRDMAGGGGREPGVRDVRELAGRGAVTAWLRGRLEAAGLPVGASALEEARAIPLLGPAPRRPLAGLLYVGDAAGAVDPIVGCGLSLALASAERAAAAILAALDGEGLTAERAARHDAELAALHRAPDAVASLLLTLARHPLPARLLAPLLSRSQPLVNRLLHTVAAPLPAPLIRRV